VEALLAAQIAAVHAATMTFALRLGRLYRKAAGREAKLYYMGHATMENRQSVSSVVFKVIAD
jgi:hypothetical protein